MIQAKPVLVQTSKSRGLSVSLYLKERIRYSSLRLYIYTHIHTERKIEENREMKRRREIEKGSEIRSAIEELSMVLVFKAKDHTTTTIIPIRPFLCVCNLVLQVLG